MSTLIGSLQEVLQESQLSTSESVRGLHSQDESYHAPILPEVVVFPHSTEDVQSILNIAKQENRPVYPYGMGTSLEGHIIPTTDGISIDFSEMNNIIEILADDMLVKVQPGVTRDQLNKELKKHGLFFSVDPGANATVGGMAATNASGTSSVRYGIMRDQVRNLEVVLANGSVIQTGSLAAKSSSGYNLNGLFVGSEGTLACFTELTLKVYGIPEQIVAGRATFPSVDHAVQAVVQILQAGIPVARCELVDEPSIQKANEFSDTNYSIQPTLFLEFHGNEAGLKQDVEFTKEIVKEFGCKEIEFEKDTAARNKLWEARHNLAYAHVHSSPGKKMMVTDVCVPISKLAAAITHARSVVDQSRFEGGIAGHVGDGNYHILVMFDRDDPEEVEAASKLNEEVVEFALSVGGTCTGEHGVGLGKKKYQQKEHGEALQLMKVLKQTFDPDNRMNPNKLIN